MECLRLWNTKFKTFRKTAQGTIPLTSWSLSSHGHECRRHPHQETNHETAIIILILAFMTRRQHLIWARADLSPLSGCVSPVHDDVSVYCVVIRQCVFFGVSPVIVVAGRALHTKNRWSSVSFSNAVVTASASSSFLPSSTDVPPRVKDLTIPVLCLQARLF